VRTLLHATVIHAFTQFAECTNTDWKKIGLQKKKTFKREQVMGIKSTVNDKSDERIKSL
jgi:hypothetical protein